MTGTLRVALGESRRLMRSRAAWVALLLVALLAAARTQLGVGLALADQHGLDAGLAWAPFIDGLRAGLTLTTLLLVAAAAKGLGGDLESGLVRLAVTRSASRTALVAGRFLVGAGALLAMVTMAGLGAWATARLQLDFGDLAEDGNVLFWSHEVRAELRGAWLAVLPAMLSAWAFGLFVGACSRSAAGAVATALGLLLAFDLLKESMGPAARYVFAYHAPTLIDSKDAGLPGVSQLARGYSDGGVVQSMLRAAHILPWPQTLVLVAAAAFVIRRRSL